jgi:hypothetical protein
LIHLLKDINQNLNIENALELANLILWKKSEHWDYEKEWRIVVDTSLRNDISIHSDINNCA